MSRALLVASSLSLLASFAALPALDRVAARERGDRHPSLTPSNLQRPPHSSVQATREGDAYRIRAQFRDHLGRDWAWSWGWRAAATDRDVARYGIPASMFDPYRRTPEVDAERAQALAQGLFRAVNHRLEPDPAAIVDFYRPYVEPLLELSEVTAGDAGVRARLQVILRILQDVPYGIPPVRDGERYIAGLLPAPSIFLEGWGDCDSKAYVLAAAALALGREVVVLHPPQHILLGIEAVPRPYERVHVHRGRRYVLAEAAGPGRYRFGQPHRPYPSFAGVERLPAKPGRRARVTAGRSRAQPVDLGASVWLLGERAEGDTRVLEVGLKGDLLPVALLDIDGQRADPSRLLLERPTPGRARVRIALGAAGTYEVHLGAIAPDHHGRLTTSLTHTFAHPVAVSPRAFPQPTRAFLASGGELFGPWTRAATPGAKMQLDLRLPDATAFETQEDGVAPIRWPAKAGRLEAELTPRSERLWVYAVRPGVEGRQLMVYFGP